MEIPGIIVLAGGAALAIAIFRGNRLAAESRLLTASLRAETEALRNERETSRVKNDKIRDAEVTVSLRDQSIAELTRLLKEKSKAMPWIAELVADLHWAQDEREARRLETKKHPAETAAAAVRQHAQEKKQLRIEKRLVEYRLALIDSLFPWLQEIGFVDAESVAEAKAREAADDAPNDPVAQWLSKDDGQICQWPSVISARWTGTRSERKATGRSAEISNVSSGTNGRARAAMSSIMAP